MNSKIRKHRLAFWNCWPKRADVKESMKEEVGDCDIISWKLEHDLTGSGLVVGGGMMSQRLMTFLVKYREKGA